ncbi:hypothetical protein [Prosthecodimorpha staleyi]|uniref:Uncharacterized protein n=1 Tax=Prosthecodimorpha staleyi TaxID=2840188 RepID=A0A947D9G4_9HYPH|nr:hypothetical protein [Prosthecodimorpha staleyi]MBT9292061.1 hypothetical protein [Prosthecodimorpha staleyi]
MEADTSATKDRPAPGRRRRWLYLLVALAICGVGLWVQSIDKQAVIQASREAIVSLDAFDPLSVLDAYAAQIRHCGPTTTIGGAPAGFGCSYDHPWNPVTYIVAVPKTVLILWSKASGPGSILLLLIFLTAIPLAYAGQKRVLDRHRDMTILDAAMIALAAPVLASLMALAAKWIAIATLAAFGAAISLWLTISSIIGMVSAVIAFVRKVDRTADRLEQAQDWLTRRRK